jgi:iron complex outermembrane receptor protein
VQKLLPLLGVLLLLPAPFAEADSAASPAEQRGAGELSEIVVTAQRKVESLQDVPISISAFTGADIDRA